MKFCAAVFLLAVMINGAASRIHTLRYFDTFSSQIPNFPEFVQVGIMDDLVISHYNSNTKRAVPKQEWMNKVTEEDPQYWERNTQKSLNSEQVGKGSIETAKQRLNVTDGSHIVQYMQGCDWNDETGEFRGYYQTAFDGEDFIALDWATQTWVAPKPQAFPTKLMWERYRVADQWKYFFEHVCVEYLKKYVRYGEETLKRTELPRVFLLQKSSSAPVTCFATGFYPDRAVLFWAKDGEELMEEDPGEILPNHDGTFQSSASLDLSSVPTEDWGRYSCVFQLQGVPDDLITKLDPKLIRTNERKYTPYIISAAAGLGAVVLVLIGYFVYRKCKAKQLTPQSSEPEVMQELNPRPQ